MANTYTSLHYHIVFSTKNREPWINSGIEQRVWEYIGGIARKHKASALQIGGTSDHVHALVLAPPALSPSQIAQFLKGDSSKWIHVEVRGMRGFAWQDGYGAFTVSKSQLPDVIRYIQTQREHHRKKTFQEEYLKLLRLHGIQYDERYLWS
jgi:putative transposase